MLKKLNNITIHNFLKTCLYLFLVYASIDILIKTSELKKYKTPEIKKLIKSQYPNSIFTFQNFIIRNNSKTVKHENIHSVTDSYSYKTTYFYIQNGRFEHEPNYSYPLFLIPLFIFLTFFCDLKTIKLKDLNKIEPFIWYVSLAYIVFFLISIFFYEKDNAFQTEVNQFLQNVNLNLYLK